MTFRAKMAQISESKWFGNSILSIIILSGVMIGFQTYKEIDKTHHHTFEIIDRVITGIFILEIFIKILGQRRNMLDYFKDPWNIFDFTIVTLGLIPSRDHFVNVLRMVRILRVLRLVRALPRLRMLVSSLIKSFPSMIYIVILLLLLFYMYAVVGVFIFGHNDPYHFGTLENSMLSLFRMVTLEDWTDIMYMNMYGTDIYTYDESMNLYIEKFGMTREAEAFPIFGFLYFATFIFSGSMIFLNLFIGVITSGMGEVKKEEEIQQLENIQNQEKTSLDDEIFLIQQQIEQLQSSMKTLVNRVKVEQNTLEKGQNELKSWDWKDKKD